MNYLCVCPLITFYLQTSRSFFEINFFICCLERRGSMKLCSGRVLIGRCCEGISKPPKNGVSMNFEPAVGVTKTLMILFICETVSLPSIDSNRFPCEMKNTWTTEKNFNHFSLKTKMKYCVSMNTTFVRNFSSWISRFVLFIFKFFRY